MSKYPSHWDFKCIGDFACRVRRKNVGGKCHDPMTISAVDGLVSQRDYFNKVVASKNTENYTLLHRNDFAYNKSYSDGYPVGAARRLKTKDQGIVSPLYICFELDKKQIDLQFADYLFDSDWFVQAIFGIAKEGARSHGLLNVGIDEFFAALLPIPPLPEQKKIAEILSGIDNLIRATGDKIKKLEDAKAEVSRDLFSAFSATHQNQNCIVLPLEHACDAVIDCKNRTPPYTETGYPVIRTPNVRGGKLILNDLRYTDEESYQIWTARSVPRAMDVLFTREAPLGEACLIPQGFQCCLGQRMMLLRANKLLLDPQYLLFALMSPFVQEQLGRSKGGTTVGHARVADIRNIKIPILPMEQQNKIALSLASIDSCIEHAIDKRNKMKETKNALASDLLSGRKRVSV